MTVWPCTAAMPIWTDLMPVRTVAPATPPITLEEAKAQVGATGYEEDDKRLEQHVNTATAWMELVLGRALITQTWMALLSAWPDGVLRLPLRPIQSVSTVKYYDSANVLQTFASSGNWALFEDYMSPYVSLLSSISWPAGIYNRRDAIEVTFVAGFGTKPDDVPAPIRSAILLLVGHLYENTDQVTLGNLQATELPFGVPQLIGPYRTMVL